MIFLSQVTIWLKLRIGKTLLNYFLILVHCMYMILVSKTYAIHLLIWVSCTSTSSYFFLLIIYMYTNEKTSEENFSIPFKLFKLKTYTLYFILLCFCLYILDDVFYSNMINFARRIRRKKMDKKNIENI